MKTNWEQIEKDFVAWDRGGDFNASQRQILNWFKPYFEQFTAPDQLKEGKAKEKILKKHCGKVATIFRQDAYNAMEEYRNQFASGKLTRGKIIEVAEILKKRVKTIVAEEFISPLFWEDFAREMIIELTADK